MEMLVAYKLLQFSAVYVFGVTFFSINHNSTVLAINLQMSFFFKKTQATCVIGAGLFTSVEP
jgi:hypothetical protein